MSLQDILRFIVENEKKTLNGNHTEFIIPFTVKKDIFHALNHYPYSTTDDEVLFYALSVLNRYMIKDKSLEKLFSYLCSLGQPLELFNRCGIKRYMTCDVLPMIPYQFIKGHLQKEGKQIGHYADHTFFIFYMIGNMIAFIITLNDSCEYLYIEKSTEHESGYHIQMIKTLLPQIRFP